MNTTIKNTLSDSQRKQLCTLLGLKRPQGMLSRQDVKDLSEGFFQGLLDMGGCAPQSVRIKKVVSQTKKTLPKGTLPEEKDFPRELQALVSKRREEGVPESTIQGNIRGWYHRGFEEYGK